MLGWDMWNSDVAGRQMNRGDGLLQKFLEPPDGRHTGSIYISMLRCRQHVDSNPCLILCLLATILKQLSPEQFALP